jgi:hypothetical protein
MSDQHLPLKIAHDILHRAAELDGASGEVISLPALRDAARQAGIAEHSVDRALEEHRRAVVDRARRSRARQRWLRRSALALGTLAVIYGILFLLPWSWNTTPRSIPAPTTQTSPHPDSAAT